ncbi:Glutathione S-transferase C-terminal domain-containing [Nymphon striatum]|nr:Glutathione S-transferase C-terminal domain-containing [Nymphon striatum]
MDQVYCEYFHASDSVIKVPLKSYMILFIWKMCKFDNIKLNFVRGNPNKNDTYVLAYSIKFNVSDTRNCTRYMDFADCPESICSTFMPAILCYSDKTCITGLCAVIRYILELHVSGTKEVNLCEKLLGFRKGCLMACAEVSSWTKFCEVDFLKNTQDCFKNIMLHSNEKINVPLEIYKFEHHLKQPLKIHNINKRLNTAKLTSPDQGHCFAEGMDMMLSDILLFIFFHLMFENVDGLFDRSKSSFPKVSTWYSRIINLPFIHETIVNSVLAVDEILHKKVEENNCISLTDTAGQNLFVDWDSMPREVHPAGGDLPVKRIARKCEQLDSMIREVNSIAKAGDIIVDFCSGGGHLGIPLAFLLPKCHIILVENKESSMSRARNRVKLLELPNISFYQGNLDYYKGKFDIGISLHACGVATDLVLQKCLEQRASFVCCPCCYGFVENTHTVEYPRSRLFERKNISYENYLLLTHVADQTEKKTAQYEKGRLCMQIIDSDRLHLAQEYDYKVKLTVMFPPSCTPKNHLLIGICEK